MVRAEEEEEQTGDEIRKTWGGGGVGHREGEDIARVLTLREMGSHWVNDMTAFRVIL